MTLKVRFFISLAVIMVMGWTDVFFVGTPHQKFMLPGVWHQPLHLIALLMTTSIGYLNWKHYPEKWLPGLWLAAYGMVIFILVVTAALYVLNITRSMAVIQPAINIRNIFTWPMPFLVCYMLHLLSKRMLSGKRQ